MTTKPKHEAVKILIRQSATEKMWWCTVRKHDERPWPECHWCFDGKLQKTAKAAMAEADDFCQRMDKEIVDRIIEKEDEA